MIITIAEIRKIKLINDLIGFNQLSPDDIISIAEIIEEYQIVRVWIYTEHCIRKSHYSLARKYFFQTYSD